ncbi:MAG: hypothetical protein E4H09_03790 [Spirochaetales bacterium]|nr:MAG: hypothetical protein E4H09_03790 [Spirochaetales bacterium]
MAALLAWPISELLLRVQEHFPSYLWFTVAGGGVFGTLFGLTFGSVDGITGGVTRRKWLGLAGGAAAGLTAGAIGALAGQAIYLSLGQWALLGARESRFIGLPVARSIGWAIMGMLIGAGEGARLRSLKRALIGALGGFLGGVAGGLVFEYGSMTFADLPWTRPVAALALGLLMAAGFAIIERGFLLGTLVLVTGPLKGREFPLPPGRTTIGASLSDTISLPVYSGVEPHQVVITGNRSGLSIRSGDGNTAITINEEPAQGAVLKYDDVIDVGSARFYLKTP